LTTPVWITGFEYGLATPVISGGGLCEAVTGAPTIQATTKRTGGYALRIYAAGTAAITSIGKTIAGTVTVGSVYFLWHTAPSAAVRILRFPVAAGSGPTIYFDPADSKIYPYISTAGVKSAALTVDTWYRIDWKADVSTGTSTLDVQLDGAAITQKTLVQTATTFSGLYVGFIDAVTGEVFYDDLIASSTTGDYPIGAHAVVGLRPNADGTHNNAANIMEDSAGNDIDGSTYYAYDKLDESPWITTANADYVRQTAVGTGNYCEIQFEDTAQATILGAMALLQYAAATATACTGATIIRDSNAQVTNLYGTTATPADMSETTAFYKSVVVALPSGGWTTAHVNALRCRFGYSDDAAPDPYWLAVMLEVAYSTGGSPYTMPAAQAAFALAGQADNLLFGHRLVSTQQAYTHTGQALNLLFGHKVIATQQSFTLAGQAVAWKRIYNMAAVKQDYTLAAQVANLLRGLRLIATQQTYTLTGQTVTLTYTPAGGSPYTLTAVQVSFALTGKDSNLLSGHRLISAQQNYALTHQPANLLNGRRLIAIQQSYALTGNASGLLQGHKLIAVQQSYTLTGEALNLLLGHRLLAIKQDYALTGQAVILTYTPVGGTYTLTAETGLLTLSGWAILLTYLQVMRRYNWINLEERIMRERVEFLSGHRRRR
jgi:hypothetical protein